MEVDVQKGKERTARRGNKDGQMKTLAPGRSQNLGTKD